MPRVGESITLQYFALDTVNRTGKSGDDTNHTVGWIKEGVYESVAASPAEVDATNAVGHYSVVITDAQMNTPIGTLVVQSSTPNIEIIPITIVPEGYQRGSFR